MQASKVHCRESCGEQSGPDVYALSRRRGLQTCPSAKMRILGSKKDSRRAEDVVDTQNHLCRFRCREDDLSFEFIRFRHAELLH